MGKINVLDISVANLIAAGEVVDRPSSVIKELMENAIDAGASQVTVEIQRGGIRYMRVSDNGCGMARDDVPVALKRHATSKIQDAKDLDAILTLGFRGEALAAISAVSKVRIMTKQAGDTAGTLLQSEGGRVLSVSDCGCPRGTSIIVEELFYNVPARQKFLKKDATETTSVVSVVEKVALSHPEIQIKLICDGEAKFSTMGDGELKNAIYAVLGRDFARKMMEVKGGYDGVEVTGYIGTPENNRANRNFQIFFINQRYIRSKTVSAGLEQAFTSFIPSDKFPCAVLFLQTHPSRVDVNVHPAKLEVKFSNEKLIFESVYYAVRNALENSIARPKLTVLDLQREEQRRGREITNTTLPIREGRHSGEKPVSMKDRLMDLQQGVSAKAVAPTLMKEVRIQPKPDEPREIPKLPWEEPMKSQTIEQPKNIPAISPASVKSAAPFVTFTEHTDAIAPIEQTPVPAPVNEANMSDEEMEVPQYQLIGELFHCYVILEMGDTCLIIDKHAAHERILFEELKKNLHSSQSYGQMLFAPIPAVLDSMEADAVLQKENRKALEKIGYVFEMDQKCAFLYQIPSQLDTDSAVSAFIEIAGQLVLSTGEVSITTELKFEKALYQGACKAAIKAGRIYDESHIRWICDKLLTLPDIKYCPHGRPVCFEMSKAALEHRFLRT